MNNITYPSGYEGEEIPGASKLDYLALGDSYSSGEGDTERKTILQPEPTLPGGLPALGTYTYSTNYYRQYTDNEENVAQGIPREECHISTRSYPYLLAKGMGLAEDKWGTVACSGAVIADAMPQDEYKGQDKDGSGTPRLEGYTNYQELQGVALNEFIPGRVEQLRFVEKHRPKAATLTMGGNDAGFARVIEACVNPRVEWTTTCSFASDDEKKSYQANEILSRYAELKALYPKLINKSPGVKLYVLGYPQFVNDQPSNAQCGLNVRLNGTERAMAREAVSYMNSVVKAAAQSSGAIYVDIEDSLGGYQLCDSGDKAVTGIALQGMSEAQESFHPNKKGHELIAMRVREAVGNQSLLTYTCSDSAYIVCPNPQGGEPEMPQYFATAIANNIRSKNEPLTIGKVIKGASDTVVSVFDYTIGANSPINILLYSDPVDLGTYTSSTNGGLSTTITIPNTVPVGFHTLEITTTSYSGEPIKLWQIIEVQGSDPDDRDEDSIPDSQDACMYITPSGIDADFDGIDDACDPEISTTPQIYGVRLGDSNRTYAGQPEKEHYLYIERNTRASSVTGVTGDYDPDGDGWAIVGASRGIQYATTTVPDTGPAANFEVVGEGVNTKPYVYLRAGGWGCATYRPTSLSKVTASQSRTLTRTAINTDKCRQELALDDVDGNGVADNEQPLYIARNGDESKGEDPSRIYLHRNYYAAESQLGISDYTPTWTAANTIAAVSLIPAIGDTPNHPVFGRAFEPIQEWNLLSVSKQNEYIPAFSKLVMLEDVNSKPLPVILTKKQNGQCIAYKPSSTGIIKFNQQNNLVKLGSIPEGESCE